MDQICEIVSQSQGLHFRYLTQGSNLEDQQSLDLDLQYWNLCFDQVDQQLFVLSYQKYQYEDLHQL